MFLYRFGQISLAVVFFSKAVLKRIPTVTNSLESRMVVPSLPSSSALQFPRISLYPGIQMTRNLCFPVGSFKCVRHLYIVLDFSISKHSRFGVRAYRDFRICYMHAPCCLHCSLKALQQPGSFMDLLTLTDSENVLSATVLSKLEPSLSICIVSLTSSICLRSQTSLVKMRVVKLPVNLYYCII